MDKNQLTGLIIIPMLKQLPSGFSEESVCAIQMIIAHESANGRYIKQVGGGPALGFIQMEPATHASVWEFGDSVWNNALNCGILTGVQYKDHTPPEDVRLLWDIRYNIFMARQRLFMKPEALPKTFREISTYLKKHWNSTSGAADPLSYFNAFLNWK